MGFSCLTPPLPCLALQGFPTGITAVWAVAFHGGIAAMLGLYLLFWTQLNLATTLPLVGGLGLFIAFTGYKALSGLVDARGTVKAVEKKTN
jgi:oligosaccharyltransferase complex subunit delta (ribophorin II)